MLFHEDIHYVDPNQQTWTFIQSHWNEYLDENDFATPEEGFVQHLTNIFDYRFTPVRLQPEVPMSGRIDLFERVQSFYDNMPPSEIHNLRKSTSAQSFDLESVQIVKDTYLKKSEEIDIKKFEDVNGVRDEGIKEHHVLFFHTGNMSVTLPNNQTIPLPVGNHSSYEWDFYNVGQNYYIRFIIKYKGGIADFSFKVMSPGAAPTPGQTTSDIEYLRHVPFANPVGSAMFEDYFDQQEPDVLDYIEEERWTRIDNDMMTFLTTRFHDHDDDIATPEVETGRTLEIDRREWQQSDYLYANTGHTTVHFQRVNGIVSKEHKR